MEIFKMKNNVDGHTMCPLDIYRKYKSFVGP